MDKPKIVILSASPSGLIEIISSLTILSKKSFLDNVSTWVGVGNSSVVAAFFSLGICFEEIISFVVHNSLSCHFSPFRFVFEEEKLLENIKLEIYRIFEKNSIRKNMTLRELADTGKRFITLAFNKTRNVLEYFYDKTYPDMTVVDALLCSLALPGVYKPYYYDGNFYIEASFLKPYPIDVFSIQSDVKVLGIYTKPVSNIELNRDPVNRFLSKIEDYYSIQVDAIRGITIQENKRDNIYNLELPGSSSMDTKVASTVKMGIDKILEFPDPTAQE